MRLSNEEIYINDVKIKYILPAEKEQPTNRIFREKHAEKQREREMKRRRFCGLCFSLSDCLSDKEFIFRVY